MISRNKFQQVMPVLEHAKFQRHHSVKAELGVPRLEIPKRNLVNLKSLQQNIASAVASVQVLSQHIRPESMPIRQFTIGGEDARTLSRGLMQNKDFVQFNEIQSRQPATLQSKTNGHSSVERPQTIGRYGSLMRSSSTGQNCQVADTQRAVLEKLLPPQ